MTLKLGYLRLSKDDGSSYSIENQKAALKEYDPTMKFFIDRGVSGYANLDDPKSAWCSKLLPVLEANPTAQVVVYSLDRLGRSKGAVLHTIEKLLRGGGTLFVVRDEKLYDDDDDFSQSIQLTFESMSNHSYRAEVKKKTLRALDVLQEAGVKLGRKPSLTDKHIAQIHELRERGLGFTAIGKVVRTQRKDGVWVNTTPRVVKAVLDGSYVSREEWELRNELARRGLIRGGE